MADIQLRFHKDMLVLSTPVEAQLRRIGMDFARDNELALLIEPEILHEAYALEVALGAQCIVTDTANLTPARLAHSRCTATADQLAQAALAVVNELSPQHVLVELAPCGLPLDPDSADSLNENRDQYIRAARAFAGMESQFDAFFLNGFTDTTDLKCALMGLRKVSDKPIFASVDLAVACRVQAAPHVANGDDAKSASYTLGGKGRETMRDAAAVMAEYGAQVAGFAIAADPEEAQTQVEAIKATCMLSILVQLVVDDATVSDVSAPEESEEFENPFGMLSAQVKEFDYNAVGSRNVTSAISANAGAGAGIDGVFDGSSAADTGRDASTDGVNPDASSDANDAQNPYPDPDTMIEAAERLQAAGVQFLRAAGNATPSYTGVLVAATMGEDVALDQIELEAKIEEEQDLDELAAKLRARLDAVLKKD